MDNTEQHGPDSTSRQSFEGGPDSVPNAALYTDTSAQIDQLDQRKMAPSPHDSDPNIPGRESTTSASRPDPVKAFSLSDEDRFTEITLKLRLLPVIVRLLCLDGIPSLEDSRHRALRTLDYARFGRPEDTVLHARCCYYVGVAEYLLYLHSTHAQAVSRRQTSVGWFRRALEAEPRYPEGGWAAQWMDFCDREEVRGPNPNAEAGSVVARGIRKLGAWLMESRKKALRPTRDSVQDGSEVIQERVPSFSSWPSTHQPSARESGSAPSLTRSGTTESTQETNMTEEIPESSEDSLSIDIKRGNKRQARRAPAEHSVSVGKDQAPKPFFSPSMKPDEPNYIRHYGEMTLSPIDYSSNSRRLTYPPIPAHFPTVDRRRATFAVRSPSRMTEDDEEKPSRTLIDRRRRKSSWGQVLGLTRQRSGDDLALAEAGESPRFAGFEDYQIPESATGRQQALSEDSSISPRGLPP